jgi:hypothetical protein
MIATDDPDTHAELSRQWPIDAFTCGIGFPRPKTTSIRATAHHVPVDIQLNEPEVVSELESQGITLATRRHNKATNEPTEYVTIHINSKQAAQSLLGNKLKLALCRFRVTIDEKVIQCYKCQKVGHTAANCTNQVTCLRCGGDHSHKDCSAELKCANCQGSHAACARKCPSLKPAPKPTQPPKSTTQATNSNQAKSWSSVVTNKHNHQQAAPPTTHVQQLIDEAIDRKVKPMIENLVKLTTELTLLLSHRQVYALSSCAKLNTAAQHITKAINYNIDQDSVTESLRNLIAEAIRADQAATQNQIVQPPAQSQTQQQTQQSKRRKSRSPSPPSISDLTISDPNNTNMDIENSALQTPNVNNNSISSIQITKVSHNTSKNYAHNSSRHPNKQTRQSSSTLYNKTIAQSNKESTRNNV